MNYEKIKISVLVPVYNSAKNLETCLNSLMNQTIKDIEIIVINDGSSDNSLEIAQKFADDDSRFCIIDKNNTGYGDSLNCGIRKAKAEYIGIVESDDYVDNDMFEQLYKYSNESTIDIVKGKYCIEINNENNKKAFRKTGINIKSYNSIPKFKIFDPKKYKYIFYLMPSVWSAIYKKDFIISNDLFFTNTPKASFQDRSFTFKAYTKAESMFFVDKIYYHYCPSKMSSSITQTSIMTNFIQQMEIFTFLMRNNIVDEFMVQFLTATMQDISFDISRLDKSYHKDIICLYSMWFKHLEFYNLIPYNSLKRDIVKNIKTIISQNFPDLSDI